MVIMIKATKRVAVHPGKLLSRVMKKARLTQTRLAHQMGVAQPYIKDVCCGKIGISGEIAKKLAKALNQSPAFWMNAQTAWELSQAPKGWSKSAKVKRGSRDSKTVRKNKRKKAD